MVGAGLGGGHLPEARPASHVGLKWRRAGRGAVWGAGRQQRRRGLRLLKANVLSDCEASLRKALHAAEDAGLDSSDLKASTIHLEAKKNRSRVACAQAARLKLQELEEREAAADAPGSQPVGELQNVA